MEPVDILKQHLVLCQDVYQLLLEENTWLKQKKVPEMHFLEKKKVIVQRLEGSLSNLKKIKARIFLSFDDSKKLVGESHSKLLQIFYLDRENEDLLVKLNQPLDRQSFNRFTVGPDEINQIHNRGQ